MRAATLLPFVACALSAVATGQYFGEPALKLGPVAAYPALGPGEIMNGVSSVQQYEIRPWTGSSPAPKAGLFYCALTHSNGVMTGLWDMTAPAGSKFTKHTDVDAISANGQFARSVSSDIAPPPPQSGDAGRAGTSSSSSAWVSNPRA